jgi:toll-like receptor 13
MVFPKNFVLSQWCQFEVTHCLRHAMDYDDALLVVCLDGVASREMTTSMMAVMKTTTYIQWAEHPDAIHALWGRVRQSKSKSHLFTKVHII